jgi:hypothetical protein
VVDCKLPRCLNWRITSHETRQTPPRSKFQPATTEIESSSDVHHRSVSKSCDKEVTVACVQNSPYIASTIYTYTGVPGGKVSILGGHIIGHSKQNMYMYMCPIPNCFRDRAISLYTFRIFYKKEMIIRTVSNKSKVASKAYGGVDV